MPVKGNQDSGADHSKYDFIEEQIVPKRKNKVKRYIFYIGTTVVLAIIFGVVSRAVFCISGYCLDPRLGEDRERKFISFSSPSPQPESSPAAEPSKEPEKQPDDIKIVQNVVEATLKDYTKMYSLLTDVAKEFNKSVVTVSSVISGVDWFDNPSEQLDASYGVIIANNGEELLILASKDKIEDATSMRITFGDDFTIDAALYGYDTETRIAVLAVPIEKIPESTLDSVEVAILGDSYYLPAGTPVLALGSPNGYVYSMETGIVTGNAVEAYITDSKVELFHTDMINNSNGEGVIVSLSGQVLGIITHNFNSGLNENLCTILGITRMKPVIEKLVNQSKQVYFGIIGNDIPKEYAEQKGIESGIYVTEVITGSPAFKAGIKNGDIITSIDNTSISSMSAFSGAISSYVPKNVIGVMLVRTTKEKENKITVPVTLGEKK